MRGKACDADISAAGDGITPAYAGKRTARFIRKTPFWDHPRLCGEKLLLCEHCGKPIGSPPPMRGKVIHTLVRITIYRITPAYAGKSCGTGFVRNAERDHPRLCGEKPAIAATINPTGGSPPPMRGKAFTAVLSTILVRITPAYAGKRFRGQRGSKIHKDHPRLCGEKGLPFRVLCPAAGSPPPMRGKGVRRGKWQNAYRITPAYAGKSFQKVWLVKLQMDHPRLCGEKFINRMKMRQLLGSPPPMRGKGRRSRAKSFFVGITPAYAGKSTQILWNCFFDQDHPRLCGEKAPIHTDTPYFSGSPPPMRGKVRRNFPTKGDIGITPAYAGKRKSERQSEADYQDHPRLCGEKSEIFQIINGGIGSPPPMRGKVAYIVKLCLCFRITPAYAGKSGRDTCSAEPHKDHPRLCGEKSCMAQCRGLQIGSPPPMRGKGRSEGRYYRNVRITPAYAGKSVLGDQCCHLSGDHPRLCGEKHGFGGLLPRT